MQIQAHSLRLVGIAGLAALAAGCGGSPAAPSSSSSNGAIAFAQCMRSHQVPNWPDPSSSGAFDKSKLTLQQLGVSSSRLQAAQTACSHFLPNGGSRPNAVRVQQERAQGLAFARCVRGHGVPSFPDPDSTGRIPEQWPGVDQGSPTFEAANQACGKYRPPYVPSNAAYNAYARSHG